MPVFGRDLLEAQVLSPTRSRKLFSVFVNHLKSNFVRFDDPDPESTRQANNVRRRRQAEVVRRVVDAKTRPNSRYVVVGDMNDAPESDTLGSLHRAAHRRPRPRRREPARPSGHQPGGRTRRCPVDPSLQREPRARQVRAVRPDLVEPVTRTQARPRRDRTSHQMVGHGRRRRNRSRPGLDPAHGSVIPG